MRGAVGGVVVDSFVREGFHLDPFSLDLLDEILSDLRKIFVTGNAMTLPISGTGSAGMERRLANAIEE